MANNFRRLKEEADIGAVVDYCGLEVVKRGSANFILCPQPDHKDTKNTNCYFKAGWNNVYCTACHKATNAIDLLMYSLGLTYGEAAEKLWEIEGCPDWYKDSNWKNKSSQIEKKVEFHLTRDEAYLLGINFPGRVQIPVGYTFKKKQDKYTYESDDVYGGYTVYKPEFLVWNDFMTEPEFIALVINKANEKLLQIENMGLFYKKIEKLMYKPTINTILLQTSKNLYKMVYIIRERAMIAYREYQKQRLSA